jgi:ribosomal protein L7/L12
MMNYAHVVVNGRSYSVTKPAADAIEELARVAQEASRIINGDGPQIPVYLVDAGKRVIAVIKEYRSLTGMNLKDSKYAVDKVRGGGRLLLGQFHTIQEAQACATPFREAGATVTVPSPLILLAQQAGDPRDIE